MTQALSFGVPMVVAGMSEDKPEVSARVTWIGKGIYIPTDKSGPEEIRDTVDQILTKPGYRARAEDMTLEFSAYESARKFSELLDASSVENLHSNQTRSSGHQGSSANGAIDRKAIVERHVC